MEKIRVGVVGATSLTARLLLQFLCRHPHVETAVLTSESSLEKPVAGYYTFLRGIFHGKFVEYNQDYLIGETDLVFLCKQHGEFLPYTLRLFEAARKQKPGFKIIDLSADFRLKDPQQYMTWYKFDHSGTAVLAEAVYGLPELHRDEIKDGDLIANPGCYPTTAILGAAPFMHHRLVEPGGVIIDAYSGTSGAGMRPNERNMAITTMENILPYKIGTHQHTPEIEQELSLTAKERVTVMFVPHVAPFRFGMCANIYLKPHDVLESEKGTELLKAFYQGEPFVRVLDPGEYPEVRNVVGTNWCEIGYVYDPRTSMGVVMSALDNAIKGASGQAVQNMNILYGWDERTGLT
ncbi:MAG: N-acetyl-gamma-glutamyl-phosphate reductase [Deltaproteobacteria bacterium]|nr:N-acetyl-gamma-glutamyl-phosphate reductase [Deltaproteobacteria bacterium]